MTAFKLRPDCSATEQQWTSGPFDSWKEGDRIDFAVSASAPGYACGDEPSVHWDVNKHEGNDVGVGFSEQTMPTPIARAFAMAILAACDISEGLHEPG